MIEPKIKGNFFERIFEFIKKKLGDGGLEQLGQPAEAYKQEVWYPYPDFCNFLRKINELLPDLQPSPLYKLGHFTMFKDERWQAMFKGQTPKDVFGTNKRQDALFMVGRFLIEKVEDDMVQVRMTLWSDIYDDNAIWATYYWGIMAGVLSLTGAEGTVDMEEAEEDGKKHWVYTVRW